MANSNGSTFSRYLSVSSAHIDSLISYVQDVKPYHTKLSEIVEEFLFEDSIKVKISERHETAVVLGPDFLNKSTNPNLNVWDLIGNSRPTEWLSAERTIISDGTRKTFPVPTTVITKLLSQSSREKLTAGINDDLQIPGLLKGVYNPLRWEGPGIPYVYLDGVAQGESTDYHLSYGAFSFNTYQTSGGPLWKQSNVASISSFASYSGGLTYDNVLKKFGSITDISATTYEEWTLTWNGTVLNVEGSTSGFIGTAAFNVPFTSPQINFTFTSTYGDPAGTPPLIIIGDKFVVTPREKITIAADAPEETWTLIKTNPQALVATPSFNRIGPTLTVKPSLNIYTKSLEWTPGTQWELKFLTPTTYQMTAQTPSSGQLAGYPKVVDLTNGCSFKDDFIQFTLVPPLNGFNTNDRFTFEVKDQKENYLVYGSVSGWQPSAQIGKWYWNGKIGFKVPSLDYFAVKTSATISVSADAENWTTAVVSEQEFTNLSYINSAFLASGAKSIVGGSSDGSTWSDDVTGFIVVNNRLVVIGDDGLIAETEDGLTWYRVASHTNNRLFGIDCVPTITADEAATDNLVVVVGEQGTILTSLNAFGWVPRPSGTTNTLKSVAHSTDWMIVVGDGGLILKSQDRLTWTPVASPTSDNLNKVKFLNGAFWAVGDHGALITSADGLTWTAINSGTFGMLNDIAYGNGIYIAVGHGGFTTKSTDGVNWTAAVSKSLNSIEFGPDDGVFVSVEQKTSIIPNFTPLRPVHSVAVPSVYAATFRKPTTGTDVVGGTIKNNQYGYQRGFKIDEPWADDLSSFKIGPSFDVYRAGETINIYLAPRSSFVVLGNYDDLPYESTYYDAHVGELEYPLDLLQEYFPLVHSHGSVIFPVAPADGTAIIIDKAASDSMRFRISKGIDDELQPAEELAPENGGWIPLEFRYFDRRVNANSEAEFPDLTTYLDAYLASDPNVKAFTISQPRYKTTARPTTAVLTFDSDFFSKYLPERMNFSLRFNQADSYGQTVRVKISENIRMYARVRLIFDEIASINISDVPIQTWDIWTMMTQEDSFNVSVVEGGGFPVSGFEVFPYDTVPFDSRVFGTVYGVLEGPPGTYTYTGNPTDFAEVGTVVSHPAIEVDEGAVEGAATAFAEGLQIIVSHTDSSVVIFNLSYDVNTDTPSGGVYVPNDADQFIVTHNFVGSTPSVLITPDVGAPFTVTPTSIYTPVPGATTASFSCIVPSGTAPFRLSLS